MSFRKQKRNKRNCDEYYEYEGSVGDHPREISANKKEINWMKKSKEVKFIVTIMTSRFFESENFDNILVLEFEMCLGQIEIWPRNLKKLILIDYDLELKNLPESLEEIYVSGFRSSFNHPIDQLPRNIRILSLGCLFNKPLGYYDTGGNPISYLPPKLVELLFMGTWDPSDRFTDLNYYQSVFNHPIKDFLPKTLKSLHLSDLFSHSIEELPEDLETLIFGLTFNQTLPKLPDNIKKMQFGIEFNQSVDNLPIGLKELIFDGDFNQTIDNLPEGLEILKILSNLPPDNYSYFGTQFNQTLDNLPSTIKKIWMGIEFNQPADFLPVNLDKLTLSQKFNQELNNLPVNLRKLKTNKSFKQSLRNLPESLEKLTLLNDSAFELADHIKFLRILNVLPPLNFPKKMEKLFLNRNFNYPIDHLFTLDMENLRSVFLSPEFNHPIDNLPDSVEELVIGREFSQDIRKFPKNLKKLLMDSNEVSIDFKLLPDGLKKLCLVCNHYINQNDVIDDLPDSLELLIVNSFWSVTIHNLPKSLKTLIVGYSLSNNYRNVKNKYRIDRACVTGSNIALKIGSIPESLEKLYLHPYFVNIPELHTQFPLLSIETDELGEIDF